MKKTPLLQKLRNTGGTLYVFPSATEDIGLNLQSTTTGVAMSHFALLNIPKLTIENCLQECSHEVSSQNGNEALAMSLQNYTMNFETYLTNLDSYNYQKLETVSEQVFWHWAMHVGILNPSILDNTQTGNDDIFIENTYNADNDVTTQDNTVIKCFGSIDAGNQLSTEFGMFNETYINIPTSWGSGPVYLKRSSTENYILNNTYTLLNGDHLEGRDDSESYYSYTNEQDYPFFDNIENAKYQYKINNLDGLQILKDINEIQTASRVKFNNNDIVFDSYDDINIDILNRLHVDQQFDFNAILLYYSVYDQDDLVKTAYATNLFGIIFLDGARMEDGTSDTFYIPTITKRKSTTTQFGNSYSFRVNLKTMSVYDNTDAIIQDNTTLSGISAVEFSDAISNMNRAIDIMNSNLTTCMTIQDQYAAILNYYDNFAEDIKDISTCLNAYLKGTRSSFIDTSVVYAKEIRTSEAKDSIDLNQLIVRTHTNNIDNTGNIIYNEPVVTIKDNSVNIPILYNTSLWLKKSYVIEDTNPDMDLQIFDPSTQEDTYVHQSILTLDKAFNSSDGFVVKTKIYEGNQLDRVSYNELYIDTQSPIFTNDSNQNLQCLLDASININYIGIIPYLVAEIQRLHKLLNDVSARIQ